ncbi:MAG: hypothetical protein FJZ96_06095 [Chloroflexi bacterium]|nr:hypothetical protein [Chloroflexota bacterium]
MNQFMNELPALLGSLGIALCCGLPLLGFAFFSFYAGRKHARNLAHVNGALPARIATLKPGSSLVRVEGVIGEVPKPIDGPPETPLAVLRVKVEEYKDEGGWSGAADKTRAVPFLLGDETGSIQVDPQGLDRHALGPALAATSAERLEAAAILLGIAPAVFIGQTRSQVWELRSGQRVTVIGTVQQCDVGTTLARDKKGPFLVTPLLGKEVQVQTEQQVRTSWVYTAILGIPGLLFLCCGLVFLLTALFRMVQPR